MTSILLNGCLGFGMLLAALFSLTDIEGVLKTATNYPYMQIFLDGTKSLQGATAMASIVVALAYCATIGFVATSSRMTWSFARDRGLPFSSFLGKVRASCRSMSFSFHNASKCSPNDFLRTLAWLRRSELKIFSGPRENRHPPRLHCRHHHDRGPHQPDQFEILHGTQ